MKVTHYFLGLSVATLMACSESHYVNENNTGEISFVSANLQKLGTRVSLDGSAWDAGDAIGVSIHQDGAAVSGSHNVKYIAQSAGLNTTFTVDDAYAGLTTIGNSLNFIAYHPFSSNLGSDNFVYPISLASQTGGTSAHDLMIATTASEATTVALTFYHKLSQLNFYFVDETGAGVKPTSVVVKGMNTTANYNLYTNEISNAGTAGDIAPCNLDGLYYAILLPTALTDAYSVQAVANGNTYNWVMTKQTAASAITSFVAGSAYGFKITLPGSTSEEVTGTPVAVSGIIEGWNDATAGQESGGESGGDDNTTVTVDVPASYTIYTPADGTTIIDALTTAVAEGKTEVALSLTAGATYTVPAVTGETTSNTVPASITGLIIYCNDGIANLSMGTANLVFAEGTTLSQFACYNLNVYGESNGGGYLINSNKLNVKVENILLNNCEFSNIRGVIRFQSTNAQTVGDVLIENCLIHDIGNYNLVTVEAASTISSVTVKNTTIYAFSARLVYLNKSATNNFSMNYTNCTIVGTSTSNNILDINANSGDGTQTTTLTFHNNILDGNNYQAVNGSTTGDVQNSYYTEGSSKVGVGESCGYAASDFFKDYANNNFTINIASFKTYGDQRWNK